MGEPTAQWQARKLKRCERHLRDYRRGDWQPNEFREALRSEYWRGHDDGLREARAELKARIRALEDTLKLAGMPLPEDQSAKD